MHDIYRLVLEQRRAQGLGFPLDFIWLCDRIHNPLWILSNDVVWSVIFSLSASEEFHLCRELSSGSSSFLSLPFPSIGWAIRHIQSEASSIGQTEGDKQVKLLPSASLLPVPPGQHPLHVFIHPECNETTQVVLGMHKGFVCVCVHALSTFSVFVLFETTGMQPWKIKYFIIVVKDLNKFINSTSVRVYVGIKYFSCTVFITISSQALDLTTTFLFFLHISCLFISNIYIQVRSKICNHFSVCYERLIPSCWCILHEFVVPWGQTQPIQIYIVAG